MRNAIDQGLRQLRADVRHYSVAALSMVVGIALLFGTVVTSFGSAQRLSDGIESLGGFGEVGIVPATAGSTLTTADAEQIAALPGVTTAVPTLSRTTAIRVARGTVEDERLTVTGYPTTLNAQVVGLPVTGRLPSQGQPEVLVPTDVAELLSVAVGQVVLVTGSEGPVELRVVGTVDPAALGLFARDNVFVDLSVAQDLFSAPDVITRVELVLASGTSTEQWLAETRGLLPPGSASQDTAALTAGFAPLLATVSLVLVIASTVTLLVAAMLAATAFSRTVAGRRNTYAVMRTVGARGSWLAGAVLTEAAVLGLACSIVGVVAGLGVSRLLDIALSTAGSLPAADLSVAVWQVVAAIAAGVLAAILGAGRQVRSVLRQSPVHIVLGEPVRDGRGARLLWSGALLAVVGGASLAVDSPLFAAAGLVALLASAGMLAPGVLVLISRQAGWTPWPALVALRRLHRHPTLDVTSGITAVVVCLGAALVMSVGALGAATESQISRQFGADVRVTSALAVTEGVGEAIAAEPGVAIVAATVTEDVELVLPDGRTEAVAFQAVDPATFFATASLPWAEGDDDATPARLAAGDAVVVPQALGERLGLTRGDEVVLQRGGQEVPLTIVATYASLITGNQVVVDSVTGVRLGAEGADTWNVAAADGVDVAALRDALAARLDGVPGLSVISAAEMRERAVTELGGYSSASFGVVGLTLGLGALGAAGVMAMGVLRRGREIGIYRVFGVGRRGIAVLVLVEAAVVGVVAAAVGTAVGLLGGTALTRLVAGTLGVSLDLSVPWPPLLGVAGLAVASVCLAAVLPSRRASAINATVALRSE